MANGRVQVQDLQGPEGLKSVGAVDTYVAPQQPDKDNRLASLADALGTFNTGLQHFGSAYATHQRLAQKGENDQWEEFKAKHTQPEYLQAVKDGTVPRFADPKVQAAVQYTTEQYTANTLRDEVAAKVQTGELKYGDGTAQAYAEKRRGEIVEQNGWNKPGTGRGFGETYNSLFQQLHVKGAEEVAAAKANDYNTAAYQQVEMFATNAQQKGLTPDQAHAEFNKLKGNLSTAMHLTPKEMDDTLIKELGRRADQDPNWVYGMAIARRTGTDGKPLPPLSDNPAYADVVNNWKKKADTFNANAYDSHAEAQVGDKLAEALVKGDGSFTNIHDATYQNPVDNGERVIKAEKQKDLAVARYETQSQKQAIDNRETPQQTFDREASVFIQNGLERPQWKKELTAAPNLANNTDLTNPKAVQRLVAAAQTYDRLEGMSPAYARSITDEKTRTFYAAYRVMKDYATNPDGSKMSDVQVLNSVGSAIRNDTPELHDYVRKQVTQMETTINGLTTPHNPLYRAVWGTLGYDVAPAANTSQITGELRRLSTVLIKSGGISAEDAVKASAKYIADTTQIVNGQWMPKDQASGIDFPSVSNRVIDNYVKEHGSGVGLAKGDVTLRSAGNGYFELTDRNGQPVVGGGRFSRGDLLGVQTKLKDEEKNAILTKQGDAAKAASDNAARGGGINILPPVSGPAAPGPEIKPYKGLGDGSEADKARQAAQAAQAEKPSKFRQWWDDLTQGDPQHKLDEVMSGKAGVNPNSPLGKSIIEHQHQRIREKQAQ